MNIELKAQVLKASIEIETKLSELLLELLSINKEAPKTLGKTGSALSFKSKTDLLLDIDKIDLDLYKDLILFMEIRNQFIHNIDTNSFEIVIERVKKENHLLSFLKNKTLGWLDKEKQLEFAFSDFTSSLHHRLLDVSDVISAEKVESFQKILKEIVLELKLNHMNSIVEEICLDIENKIKTNEIEVNQIGKYFKEKIKENLI